MPQFLTMIFLNQWESFKAQCTHENIFPLFTVIKTFNEVALTYQYNTLKVHQEPEKSNNAHLVLG